MSDTILDRTTEPAALVAVDGKTYPLESARIVARAEGGMALSTLVQRFANPYDETLEVNYTLPLPADGAVLGFTMRVGERVIRSEVQPREAASEAYRKALDEGRTAGLLEQSRADTFRQSLGNVPARTAVEVTIDVLHPLAFLGASGEAGPLAIGSQWEYRFPTVVGVRYTGGEGRTPDAKDVSPDRGEAGDIPTRLALQLVVADALAAGLPSSPSHRLELTPGDSGCAVTFRDGERLDRDVVVRWPAAAEAVGVRLVEGGGLAGDDGRYVLVTLVPPAVPQRTYGRDVTLLVDASGSMTGPPLALGKRVAGDLLRSLGTGDRFELISFANDVVRLTGGFVEANEAAIQQALELLNALEAGGGTEMTAGIREAMKATRDVAQRQVVLVTDGQIGFEQEVVARVAAAANVRLHAVGVGAAPNRTLTRQAAMAGRGIELLVTNEADAHAAAKRLVAATASPVLTGLTARGSALTGELRAGLRDVFAGQPLLFTAEVSPSGGRLELTGRLAGEPWRHVADVPARDAAGAALPHTPLPLGALHGRAVVEQYEVGLDTRGRAVRFGPMIEFLAMRHRIASSATSLVAIAEEPSVDPNAPRRRERLAVELPHGVSAEGVGLMGAAMVGAFARHCLLKGAGLERMRRRAPGPREGDEPETVGDGEVRVSASPTWRDVTAVWRRPEELYIRLATSAGARLRGVDFRHARVTLHDAEGGVHEAVIDWGAPVPEGTEEPRFPVGFLVRLPLALGLDRLRDTHLVIETGSGGEHGRLSLTVIVPPRPGGAAPAGGPVT